MIRKLGSSVELCMTETISKQIFMFSKSKQGNKKIQTVGFAKDNIENIKYV